MRFAKLRKLRGLDVQLISPPLNILLGIRDRGLGFRVQSLGARVRGLVSKWHHPHHSLLQPALQPVSPPLNIFLPPAVP
jgi:hypothetical protein